MNPPGMKMLLASASPRRRRLIEWLGVRVGVTAVETPEELDGPLAPEPARLAVAIAEEKAVAAREAHGDEVLVLAFDTVVVLDGAILGKPTDVGDAARMLQALSGRTHEVVTGVALAAPQNRSAATFAVVTVVTMRDLDAAVVEAWLAGGEALGCAGAYNIEHHLASVADDECYHNVAGMPLCHLYAALTCGALGEPPEGIVAPVAGCDAALGRHCLLGPHVTSAEGQARMARTMTDSSLSG